ncbi:DUF3990 domain-containing protein [Blautia schinkii]|nr:DUF3990 domain-containing protein [Blautia schinkii]
MILYHGSTIAVEHPEIIKSEVGRDFGFAFYTTDIKEQAIRWARRKAMISGRKKHQTILPVISVYEWSETPNLSVKVFKGASIEWLDMITKCRSNPDYHHDYDIVIGKIANDNVGETVSYVLQGIMRKEDAIERLKFEKINNQIAFCTDKSLDCLHYKTSFNG